MEKTAMNKEGASRVNAVIFKKRPNSEKPKDEKTISSETATLSVGTLNSYTKPVNRTTSSEADALASITPISEGSTAVIPAIMPASDASLEKKDAVDTLQLCKEAFIRLSEAFIVMAYCLSLIKEREWFKLPCYGSYEDYTVFIKETFKLKRSHLYNYLKIWKRFGERVESNGKLVPRLKAAYRDFKLTQLLALTTLTEEQAAKVTPDFTVEQIRELKKKSTPNTVNNSKASGNHLSAKEARAFLNRVLKEHIKASFTVTVTWK